MNSKFYDSPNQADETLAFLEGPGGSRIPLSTLGEAWWEWVHSLDVQWDIFFTLTFCRRMGPAEALQASRGLMRQITRRVHGSRLGREKMIPYFHVAEPHANGGYHVHGMAADCYLDGLEFGDHRQFSCEGWEGEWESRHGRSVIRRYDVTRDALGYALKAVNSGPLSALPDRSYELEALSIYRPPTC